MRRRQYLVGISGVANVSSRQTKSTDQADGGHAAEDHPDRVPPDDRTDAQDQHGRGDGPGQAPAAHPVHALPGASRRRRRPVHLGPRWARRREGKRSATTTAATTSSTSCPQNRARQPRYWITGEPSVTPEDGSSGADQRPPAQGLDPLFAVEELEDQRHRGGAGGRALHTIEGAARRAARPHWAPSP